MSQINQNAMEIGQDTDDSINLLDYEEIESEIMTFEVAKAHEKVKMFTKHHDKLLELLVQQDKVEIKNLFGEDSKIKLDEDLEFTLNYDSHAGTVLYFQETKTEMTVENELIEPTKYEYIGPSLRKITIGVDTSEKKLVELLGVNVNEAKKEVQEDTEFQRLDSIYNIKQNKRLRHGEDNEDEEIYMEEEEEKQDHKGNGEAVLDVNYGMLTKEDIKDMMVEKKLNQRAKSGKKSAGKGVQPNLIRKKIIAEILSQKKSENLP